jgi:hypothetical protein
VVVKEELNPEMHWTSRTCDLSMGAELWRRVCGFPMLAEMWNLLGFSFSFLFNFIRALNEEANCNYVPYFSLPFPSTSYSLP